MHVRYICYLLPLEKRTLKPSSKGRLTHNWFRLVQAVSDSKAEKFKISTMLILYSYRFLLETSVCIDLNLNNSTTKRFACKNIKVL